MQAISSVPTGAKKKLDFAYDYQGRRIQKIVSTWNGSAYVAASTNKFLYDGWNLIAELNSTNGIVRSYIWGLDLSGTIQGAGGVGGLLAIKPTSSNPIFVAYDGNGNVNGLIDAATGTTSGQFEYGPFGETIRLTPNANNQSPFRFSTKYTDDESDFIYYGYRYYNASTGRWLSRDPIENWDEPNGYSCEKNSPLSFIDPNGLDALPIPVPTGPPITVLPPPGTTPPNVIPFPGPGLTPLQVTGVGAAITATAVAGYYAGQSIDEYWSDGAISDFYGDAATDLFLSSEDKQNCRKCKPCIPPVGSIAYRVDMPPSPAHNGIPTPHSHKFKMHQSPPAAGCKCFWRKFGKHPLPGIHSPAITSAGGGGVAP
jgi:RHS repeat-associated protein